MECSRSAKLGNWGAVYVLLCCDAPCSVYKLGEGGSRIGCRRRRFSCAFAGEPCTSEGTTTRDQHVNTMYAM